MQLKWDSWKSKEMFLMEGISQSKFLKRSKEGAKLRDSILDNKIKDMNLNMLTII